MVKVYLKRITGRVGQGPGSNLRKRISRSGRRKPNRIDYEGIIGPGFSAIYWLFRGPTTGRRLGVANSGRGLQLNKVLRLRYKFGPAILKVPDHGSRNCQLPTAPNRLRQHHATHPTTFNSISHFSRFYIFLIDSLLAACDKKKVGNGTNSLITNSPFKYPLEPNLDYPLSSPFPSPCSLSLLPLSLPWPGVPMGRGEGEESEENGGERIA